MNKERISRTIIMVFIMCTTMSVFNTLLNVVLANRELNVQGLITNYLLNLCLAIPLAYILPPRIGKFVNKVIIKEN